MPVLRMKISDALFDQLGLRIPNLRLEHDEVQRVWCVVLDDGGGEEFVVSGWRADPTDRVLMPTGDALDDLYDSSLFGYGSNVMSPSAPSLETLRRVSEYLRGPEYPYSFMDEVEAPVAVQIARAHAANERNMRNFNASSEEVRRLRQMVGLPTEEERINIVERLGVVSNLEENA